MNQKNVISSVNFHVWEPCNMRCKFCFATFQDVKQTVLPLGHLPKVRAIQVLKALASSGFQKITFAGGEPTLCPWLPELIRTARQYGMTTMIVTNGSRLDEAFFEQNKDYLDWIAVSIDSLNPETNQKLGRAFGGEKPLTKSYYESLATQIKNFGYGLKINTVVNRKNLNEDMVEFIRWAQPKRWKILQVLPIAGQNDNKIDSLEISESEFHHFVNRHQEMIEFTTIVPESNSQMKGSYAMVDPAGRFFDNTTGTYIYSKPILEIGVLNAIKEMSYNYLKFTSRGGIYEWKDKPNPVSKVG